VIEMYRVDIANATGKIQTVMTRKKLEYGFVLNGTSVFEILIEGSGADYRTQFQRGFVVYIYRDNSLDLKGIIEKISFTDSGQMVLEGIGHGEKKLNNSMCATQDWSSNTTTQIVNTGTNNILSNCSGITAGTIENKTPDYFRVQNSQTCLQGVAMVSDLTSQDWSIDYSNDELDIENHKGNASSVKTFIGGIDAVHISKVEDDAGIIEKVTVTGSNEGGNQKTGQWCSDGNACAGWSKGDPEVTLIDKSLNTDTACEERAHAEYLILSATRYTYNFEATDPNQSLVTGDVITLDDEITGTDAVELRITQLRRVITEEEDRLVLELRGTGEREKSMDQLEQLSKQKRFSDLANSMKQGTDDSTANVSDTGHLHNDGTLTGDLHLHADGTYTGDLHLHNDGTLTTDLHLHGDGTFSTDYHSHGDGSYGADSHAHGDGTYGADSHAHGDGTYGADSHAHGEGTYTADSRTSNSSSSTTGGGGGSDAFTGAVLSGTGFNNLLTITAPSQSNCEFMIVHVCCQNADVPGASFWCRIYDSFLGTYYPDSTGFGATVGNQTFSFTILVPGIVYTDTMYVQMRSNVSDQVIDMTAIHWGTTTRHTHYIPSTGLSGSSEYDPADVSGTSQYDPADVSGTSQYDPAGVSGTSDDNNAGVSGSSEENTAGVSGATLVNSTGVSGSSDKTAPGVSGDTDTTNAAVSDSGHSH